MKIIIFGANGTIGSKVVSKVKGEHEVITVGRSSGDYQADITSGESVRELFDKIGSFDALISASGEVAFAPLLDISDDQWNLSLASKLMGQINLVRYGVHKMNVRGSITLVSGILSEVPIMAGVAATTVNRAIEGFVQAAAFELPRNIRLNVVSPTLLEESVDQYGAFFPGFIPVGGDKVASAFIRSLMGIETGQIFKVF